MLSGYRVVALRGKAGFEETTAKLPAISAQLQTDNWVLARQDLSQLPTLLQQAYCSEYVLWWQNFMRKSRPLHAKDYQQAQHLTNVLHQGDSFNKIALLIQKETSPLSLQTNPEHMALFNQELASKFTDFVVKIYIFVEYKVTVWMCYKNLLITDHYIIIEYYVHMFYYKN